MLQNGLEKKPKQTPNSIDAVVEEVSTRLETLTSPIRTSFASRYPTIFMLLTTMGATATFLGFEHLLTSIALFSDHPSLILILGISILTFTGTLYKKLS